MKALMQTKKEDIIKLKAKYGINYETMNNKCPSNNHPLKVHSGIVRSYNGVPQCDECKQSDLHEHEFFFRCQECEYDLCRLCALIMCDPPVLKEEIRTSEHGCVL